MYDRRFIDHNGYIGFMPYKSFVIPALQWRVGRTRVERVPQQPSRAGCRASMGRSRRELVLGRLGRLPGFAIWTSSGCRVLSARRRESTTGKSSSPEDFEVFAQLRTLRKEIADRRRRPALRGVHQRTTRPNCPGTSHDQGAALENRGRRGDPCGEVWAAYPGSLEHRSGRQTMKRVTGLFPRITERDNLRLAVLPRTAR